MRVLVTGGCGFIGTNLLARMDAVGGFRTRVLDNESMGRREHLAGIDTEFVLGDLRDPAALAGALEGMDAVVHLAADTRVLDSIGDPRLNFEVNVQGSLNLLEAMRQGGVKRIVSASTGGAIIGDVEPPMHEGMVPRPLSPYGASKMAVEGYCSAYEGSYGFHALSLRFSNVYGPRSFHKGSVVAAFYKRVGAGEEITVYGDGSQTRDFVFVEDLCDGIIAGIRGETSGAVQLGSGVPTTLNELLDAIRPIVAPREVRVRYEAFRPGEVLNTYCDVSKARRELDFAPNTPLSEGLARTWAWFARR